MASTYTVQFSSFGSTPDKHALTISPGDINTDTSLTLPGQGKTDYGQFFDENVLHLLENFASLDSPGNPTTGQLWYNLSDFRLRYYVGITTGINNLDINNPGWVVIQSITGTPSATPMCGETHYNIVNDQFLVYNCTLQVWQELAWLTTTDNRYVSKSGSTMTGPLLLSGIASLDYHPVPKIQFDQAISTLTNNLNNAISGVNGAIGTAVADITNIANNAFPIGGIIMWSGLISSIPVHWVLCNGTNGTPDLRDRFIVGAGNGYNVGQTGGSATLSLITDPHTLTEAEMPNHSHYTYPPNSVGNAGGGLALTMAGTALTLPTSGTGGGQGHTHTIGAGVTFLPPYYALAYIMKIS
jgi:hypothetical protein